MTESPHDPQPSPSPEGEAPDSVERSFTDEVRAASGVDDALERVRRRLLDLTMRNRLLNFRIGVRAVPIVDELPREVIDSLVNSQRPMRLDPIPSEDDASAAPPVAPKPPSHEEAEPALSEAELAAEIETGDAPKPPVPPAPAPPARPPTELPQDPGRQGEIARRHRDNALQTPYEYRELEHRLRSIHRHYQDAIQSTGVNLLHLAFGFLQWYEAADAKKVRRAPLLLVPVGLERERVEIEVRGREPGEPRRKVFQYRYTLRYEGEDLSTNISLLTKLRTDFGIELPDVESFLPESGGPINPEEYFEAITDALHAHPEADRWDVKREMVLGFFSFSKFRMHLDLDPRAWPESAPLANNPLIRDVLLGHEREPVDLPDEAAIEAAQDSGDLPVVMDADSSQCAALLAAERGADLVIEGPPGTGKSQTITNLIALLLGSEKRVLFVSEKQAALDVVRAKLDSVGLGDYCLELHSHKARISSVLDDLRRRLEIEETKPRRSRKLVEDLRKLRADLVAHTHLLARKVGPNDETIDDVLWLARHHEAVLVQWAAERGLKLDEARPRLELPPDAELSAGQFTTLESALEELRRHLDGGILTKAACWRHFDPRRLLPEDRRVIEDAMRALQGAVDDFVAVRERVRSAEVDPSPWPIGAWETVAAPAFSALEPASDLMERVAAELGAHRDAGEMLDELEKRIHEYRGAIAAAAAARERTGGVPEEDLKDAEGRARELEEAGLADLAAATAPQVSERLERAASEIRRVQPQAKALAEEILFRRPTTLADFFALERYARALAELDVETAAAIDAIHFDSGAAAALAEGRDRAGAIERERAELDEIFSLRDAPDDRELREIRQDLRESAGGLFGWLPWSKRSATRKRVRRFCRQTRVAASPDIGRELERISDHREQTAVFAADDALHRRLGPLFRGVGSDWDGIGRAVGFCEALLGWMDREGAVRVVERLRGLVSTRAGRSERETAVSAASRHLVDVEASVGSPRPRGVEWSHDLPLDEVGPWLDGLRRLLDGWLEATARCEVAGARATLREDLAALRGALEAYEDERRHSARAAEITAALGPESAYAQRLGADFAGVDTDLVRLERTRAWVADLSSQPVPPSLALWIIQSPRQRFAEATAAAREALRPLDRWRNSIARLVEFGAMSERSGFQADAETVVGEEASANVRAALDGLAELLPWSSFREAIRRARDAGLAAFTEAIDHGRLPARLLHDAFAADVYLRLSRQLLATHHQLEAFDRHHLERLRQDFNRKDRRWSQESRRRVVDALAKVEPPEGNRVGRVRDYTELCLLKHEAAKKRRHIPIRQLVERAGQALLALKPCWLMSPLSVAQFLPPGELEFDLVVMDEASQIRPEDALGALARGRHVVTVGDSKQMPPSRFFEQLDGESEDTGEETALEESESILDLCRGVYTPTMLRWHYRSEHESLIEFSNQAYYDGRLVVFPSVHEQGPDYGVSWHRVEDGRYASGRNHIEARRVAEAILAHGRLQIDRPAAERRSVGAATMNLGQRDLVLDLLDRLAEEDPEADRALALLNNLHEPLFVKNLENVQGDERDHIIISCTYGPDEASGRVYQRFGPILQRGGERRLNVLFTRARRRVSVYSSLDPEDITVTAASSQGLRDFHGYLQFAAAGARTSGHGTGDGRSRAEPNHPFEQEVARVIASLGLGVRFQVGVGGYRIEAAVADPERPGRYLIGIQRDGPGYRGSVVSRDRDRLREEVLRRRGWPLHRVWAPDWFQNPESEARRLEEAVRAARAES